MVYMYIVEYCKQLSVKLSVLIVKIVNLKCAKS